MRNSHKLIRAKQNKADEFYTQYETIENEVNRYPVDTWKGKKIYFPCDNPEHSMFWRYFADNFERLGIKCLMATYIADGKNHAMFYNYGGDYLYTDVLHGNGDFRSEECIGVLKKADIVITNPPFSLFQDFVSLLIEHKKQFLVLGQINSVASNDIFSYVRDKKMWLGPSIHAGDIEFRVPDNYELNAATCRVDEKGTKHIRVKGIRWWTNIQSNEQVEPLKLTKHYNPTDYPKYDNYDAINVDKVADIPCDYDGVMGVPITFLDKYNPEQFEIIGITKKKEGLSGIDTTKDYKNHKRYNPDGVLLGDSGNDINSKPVLKGKKEGQNYYQFEDDIVHVLYARIFIKRKKL